MTDLYPGPILVHSDPFSTMKLIASGLPREDALAAHVENISKIGGDRQVMMPSFNYDFTTTGMYDPAMSPAQVGVINEWFRIRASTWRSSTPVFSFTGNGLEPDSTWAADGAINPFDEYSLFSRVADLDGEIVWYGAPFSSTTLIHHSETAAGGPQYRYDKHFGGTVITVADGPVAVDLLYHVRPQGMVLTYDWARLLTDLTEAGIHRRTGLTNVAKASARLLREFWVEKLESDPLYLLTAESVSWVKPKLQELGRRFEISDFEGIKR